MLLWVIGVGFEDLRTLEVKNALIYVSIIKTPLQDNWICLVVVSGGSSTHASSQFSIPVFTRFVLRNSGASSFAVLVGDCGTSGLASITVRMAYKFAFQI